MKIGITIDGIFRDLKTAIEEEYITEQKLNYYTGNGREKEFNDEKIEEIKSRIPENYNPYDEDVLFNIFTFEELKKTNGEGEEVIVTPEDLFVDFILGNAGYKIFSSPSYRLYDKVFTHLKEIAKNNPKHEFILFSKENNNTVPLTLLFLGQNLGNTQEIKEFNLGINEKTIWKKCKLLITDNPTYLKTKPKNKKLIKVKQKFNENIECDSLMEIGNLSDLLNYKF